jgi:hypothetical protein
MEASIMNAKRFLTGVALAASMALASTSAHALEILDGWQLDLGGGNLTTDIGHLVVSGGQATITQELDAGGNLFVGARFVEFGGLFSITYTPENCPGGCDFGAPGIIAGTNVGPLNIRFEGLTGSLTSVDPVTGAVGFAFDAGVGTVWLEYDGATIATFAIADPSGGSLANFFGAVNTSGTSNILVQVLTANAGLFKDSDGNALDDRILNGDLFAAMDTTNQIFTPAELVACPETLAGAALCSQLVVTSQGKVDLLTRVPEPATVALFGVGLLGLAAAVRRRKEAA